jgi:hypothetical protein
MNLAGCALRTGIFLPFPGCRPEPEFFAKRLGGSTHFHGKLRTYLNDNHALRRDLADTLKEKAS